MDLAGVVFDGLGGFWGVSFGCKFIVCLGLTLCVLVLDIL